jgi:hypothetical protein
VITRIPTAAQGPSVTPGDRWLVRSDFGLQSLQIDRPALRQIGRRLFIAMIEIGRDYSFAKGRPPAPQQPRQIFFRRAFIAASSALIESPVAASAFGGGKVCAAGFAVAVDAAGAVVLS